MTATALSCELHGKHHDLDLLEPFDIGVDMDDEYDELGFIVLSSSESIDLDKIDRLSALIQSSGDQ